MRTYRSPSTPALLFVPDRVQEAASHVEPAGPVGPAGAPAPAAVQSRYPITSIFSVPAGNTSNFVPPTEKPSNVVTPAAAQANSEVGGGLQVIRLDSERYSSASLKLGSLPSAASLTATADFNPVSDRSVPVSLDPPTVAGVESAQRVVGPSSVQYGANDMHVESADELPTSSHALTRLDSPLEARASDFIRKG